MRIVPVLSLVVALPLAAQQPRTFTAEDYAKAERFLAPNAVPLVSGLAGRPTWIGTTGRFWYRGTTSSGSAFYVVDPVKRTRAPLFDHVRLAAGLASASGVSTITGDRLPFQSFDLSDDMRTLPPSRGSGGRATSRRTPARALSRPRRAECRTTRPYLPTASARCTSRTTTSG
ncbi:MAG: hypothetical protein U0163_09500 [Gemmatimonadaceae bacterium]